MVHQAEGGASVLDLYSKSMLPLVLKKKKSSWRSFTWKNVFSFIVLPKLTPFTWRRQHK